MAIGTKCPSKSNVRLNIENQIKGVEKGTNSRCPFYRGVCPSIENQIKEVKKGTNCRCPFYRGVRKRESQLYILLSAYESRLRFYMYTYMKVKSAELTNINTYFLSRAKF